MWIIKLTNDHNRESLSSEFYPDFYNMYIYIYNVKLGGFQSQLQASYVSSHTEEL